MAAPKQVSLFETATRGARVVRQADLTTMIIDGGGAMIMETLEFGAAYKWAQAKNTSGSVLNDRNKFFERITVLVSRPGSFQTTRGSDKALRNMARLMKASGLELNDWNLPPEIKSGEPTQEEKDMQKAKDKKAMNDAHAAALLEDAARTSGPGPAAPASSADPAAPAPADMDDPYAGLKP
jgi:hypothetical protein